MRINKTRINRLVRQGLVYSLLLAVAILGLGGVGFWLIDPRIDSLGDGLWLAFTTAGDLVPSTMLSRGFAVVVVLLGLAVLSLVTASVSAMFVEQEERQFEHDVLLEIRALRSEVQALKAAVRSTQAPPGP